MSPILTIEHLNAFYNQGRVKEQILHDVSLELEEGEILGIVGESGCGKTTLAKAVLGMNPSVKGKISLAEGCNPQMVFQDPYSSLNPAKTVGWIMEEPLRLNTKLKKAERKEQVAAMLERVGLSTEIAQRYPRQLSGGQRQRVCIGTALMLNPRLLIADEPVSALDVTISAQIIDLLRNLQKEMGLSVVFISHDLRVVYQICKKVVIFRQGRVIESGDVDEIYNTPKESYTRELLEAAGKQLDFVEQN